MSRKSKIAFLIAFILLIATFAVQFMTGTWLNLNSVMLAGSLLCVAVAVAFDWKLYLEFLTMRTTKHGMNMGVMILLTLVFLVCINYLANRYNKTWDTTQEKLNSLSDQSEKLVKGLKEDVEFKIFFKGPAAAEDKSRVKLGLALYAEESPHIKQRYLNSYVEDKLAIEYLSALPDRDTAPVFVFAEHKGRKVRVDAPFEEAQITAALIKATREGEAKIYFVKGHGEREIESDDDAGVGDFAKALGEASFKTENINLVDAKEIPADATMLAIVGPAMPYLEGELKKIRTYLENGGRLLLALDPGQRHNLASLVKSLGGEFLNNYVITMNTIAGGGPATVLGRGFDNGSDITRNLPAASSFAVFPLVSEVKPSGEKLAGGSVNEIVKSDPLSFTVAELATEIKARPDTKAITVGLELKGQLDKATKPFEAVVFGDSDFISNRAIALGLNRDLIMNSVAQLAQQKDLISIRPKQAKGTLIVMTTFARWSVLILGLALPIVLLILSGVMWFRRRGA